MCVCVCVYYYIYLCVCVCMCVCVISTADHFSFQPVIHDWCNKARCISYPVCGMVHIKEPLLLIGKNSPCGGSGFPISLSEWFFCICPTPYTRKLKNVLSASLRKTFLSFLRPQIIQTPTPLVHGVSLASMAQ